MTACGITLTNRAATFQAFMEDSLIHYFEDFIVCYLDDIKIY